MSLITTLLAQAHGDEVPLTATLAWFLTASPILRTAVLDRWVRKLAPRLAAIPRRPDRADGVGDYAEPTIHLEVTVAHPVSGSCRYDLVLDWYSPARLRLVVEVKVWAGLTMHEELDAETREARSVDQMERYLHIAAQENQPSTLVVLLAPYAVDLVAKVTGDPRFAGQVAWQSVHDAFAAVIRASARGSPELDATMRDLAADFVHSLETRDMAAPKLTFDALTSVSRYRRFRQSVEAMLDHARARLFEADRVAGFAKGDKRAWEEDHDRMGWRMWVNPSVSHYFAFIGVYVGDETIHDEVPDLYFFLEAEQRTPARSALDARQAEIEAALVPLRTETVRWKVQPGGYEAIQARTSMVEIVRSESPEDAALAFFTQCFASLRASGELQRFLNACNPPAP